jgi:hypothetical protein
MVAVLLLRGALPSDSIIIPLIVTDIDSSSIDITVIIVETSITSISSLTNAYFPFFSDCHTPVKPVDLVNTFPYKNPGDITSL